MLTRSFLTRQEASGLLAGPLAAGLPEPLSPTELAQTVGWLVQDSLDSVGLTSTCECSRIKCHTLLGDKKQVHQLCRANPTMIWWVGLPGIGAEWVDCFVLEQFYVQGGGGSGGPWGGPTLGTPRSATAIPAVQVRDSNTHTSVCNTRVCATHESF